MINTGQFGQTYSIASECITYTKPIPSECYVCGDYPTCVGIDSGQLYWLCRQHYDEFCNGDTGWWELIRLVADG